MENGLGGSEFKEFIIDRAESPNEIDTQIDRVGGEFQKNGSCEESHEL